MATQHFRKFILFFVVSSFLLIVMTGCGTQKFAEETTCLVPDCSNIANESGLCSQHDPSQVEEPSTLPSDSDFSREYYDSVFYTPTPAISAREEEVLCRIEVNFEPPNFHTYESLAETLASEGFTPEEIAYAFDNYPIDWDKQAIQVAEAFTRERSGYSSHPEILIKRIEQLGFSKEQATNAVNSIKDKVDWNRQAYFWLLGEMREEYEDINNSNEDLVNMLDEVGFTHEEAVYAVDKLLERGRFLYN